MDGPANGTPVALPVSVRPDAEIAASLKERLRQPLEEICKILDDARAAGLGVEFQLGADSIGRAGVQRVRVIREW